MKKFQKRFYTLSTQGRESTQKEVKKENKMCHSKTPPFFFFVIFRYFHFKHKNRLMHPSLVGLGPCTLTVFFRKNGDLCFFFFLLFFTVTYLGRRDADYAALILVAAFFFFLFFSFFLREKRIDKNCVNLSIKNSYVFKCIWNPPYYLLLFL